MIGDVSLFNVLLPVLIAVAVASRGFRVDEDHMASWANWFGPELTPRNRPDVRRYLQWTRRCRTAGGPCRVPGAHALLRGRDPRTQA